MFPRLGSDQPLDVDAVGRKAAFLRDAAALGCRVPPGFVVPRGPVDRTSLEAALAQLELEAGARLGEGLVLAVRSSGRRSMPGELETLLGLGASGRTLDGLTTRLGDPARAALLVRDSLRGWRRIVRGVRQATIAPGRAGASVVPPAADLLREVADLEVTAEIPTDPVDALEAAIAAVSRIGRTRAGEDVAVVVQCMALGGAAQASGSAVVLSRHALTGTAGPVGEWAPSVAGDALTSGRLVSPPPFAATTNPARASESLERKLPDTHAEIARWVRDLERAHRDAVELEVTIEDGVPHLVQVRPSKLAPKALARVSVALVELGVLTKAEALERVSPDVIRAAGSSVLPPSADVAVIATGLPASPGVASGRVKLTAEDVLASPGEPVVMIRPDASPEDAPAVRVAAAVVTASGGLTSHAAVMSRALGRPCVVSASTIAPDAARGIVTTPHGNLTSGDWVTVDGSGGRLLRGKHEATWSTDVAEVETLLRWRSETH